VVGSINQDYVLAVDRRPGAGETVTGATLSTHHGGKGANQAVAAAACGANVRFLARVGDDAAGPAERRDLERRGVDTSLVAVAAGTPTGAAFITVTPDGENAVAIAPGANDLVRAGDVRAVTGLISVSSVLVVQFETPLDAVAEAISVCGPGTQVLLNAAPWRPLPETMLDRVDTLVVNEHEAASFLGAPVADIADARAGATTLLGRGPRAVVMTLGALGAVRADAGGCSYVPAPSVPVVDTIGSGDVFVGTLAALLSEGQHLDRAVATAVHTASASVAFVGARPPVTSEAEGPQAPLA
jgi:ribokinase